MYRSDRYKTETKEKCLHYNEKEKRKKMKKRIVKMKKKIVTGILLSAIVLSSSSVVMAKSYNTGSVRRIFISGTSSVSAAKGGAVTGSDPAVIVGVEATYRKASTATGKIKSSQKNAESNGRASVAFTAGSGYKSVSIHTRHFANYNGHVNYIDTSNNY